MRRFSVAVSVFCLIFSVATSTQAESSLPKKKQTTLGLYLTAKEAFGKWHGGSEKVAILDVRTPEEYIFVGHASMARNIPVKLFDQKLTAEKRRTVLKTNPLFVSDVRKHFKDTETILVMCRSGGRSAVAVNLLAEAGFKKVYNITDGFEGDLIKDPQSYFNGKRAKNGWKNSGATWTYELDPVLMYHP